MEKDSWLLAGVLLFAGYGFARSLTACTPMVSAGQKLFLVGDSLAVGMNRHFRGLAQKAGVNYSSATKSGTATSYWTTAGFAAQLQAAKPNLVLVSLGTNDSAGSRSNATHSEAIRKLVAMIQAAGAEVFWILPPKLPWKQSFSDLVRAEGIEAFDSSALEIPMGPDRIHPTGAGYAGWAGFVWKAITCGERQTQALSGAPPAVRRTRPKTGLVRPAAGGVFAKPKRRG